MNQTIFKMNHFSLIKNGFSTSDVYFIFLVDLFNENSDKTSSGLFYMQCPLNKLVNGYINSRVRRLVFIKFVWKSKSYELIYIHHIL